mmetsp:Transcript_50471/g.127197  ORF Transcript_50471/g.127197 Transcript_50471/m.127197 type:complete len:268 (+) Transcript_50471:722-1525(+)
MQHLLAFAVGIILHLLCRDAEQRVDNAEKGAQQVVGLVAHLWNPPPQCMANEQRREEAIPNLAQSNEHEERNDRLSEDEQQIELHCCRSRLPRLHRLPMRPCYALEDALRHRPSTVRRIGGTSSPATSCAATTASGLSASSEEFLIFLFLLLVCFALPPPSEQGAVGTLLCRSTVCCACRRRLWPRTIVPSSCARGFRNRCRSSSNRIGLYLRPETLEHALAEDPKSDHGQRHKVQQRRQRSDDDGRDEGYAAAYDTQAPQVHEELL